MLLQIMTVEYGAAASGAPTVNKHNLRTALRALRKCSSTHPPLVTEFRSKLIHKTFLLSFTTFFSGLFNAFKPIHPHMLFELIHHAFLLSLFNTHSWTLFITHSSSLFITSFSSLFTLSSSLFTTHSIQPHALRILCTITTNSIHAYAPRTLIQVYSPPT